VEESYWEDDWEDVVDVSEDLAHQLREELSRREEMEK
jgi:hypothetical protein